MVKMEQSNLIFESRLTKVEIHTQYVIQEIKEIKNSIRWMIGILLAMKLSLLGLLVKGFNLI